MPKHWKGSGGEEMELHRELVGLCAALNKNILKESEVRECSLSPTAESWRH